MKHSLYIIFALFIICSCQNKNRNHNKELDHCIDDIKKEEPLFFIKSLSDTLSSFLTYTDTIPSRPGASKITIIDFFNLYPDTIVQYSVYTTLLEVVNSEYTFFVKGGCRVNGEDIAVYYAGFEKLNNIVNEKVLSLDYIYHVDSLAKSRIPDDDPWTYISPRWEYKYSNGELKLISKKTGSMDKIYK